ncbi:MAG: hypothetical protein IPK81_15480 [Rhodospirillales bacterium]|nr:MAG: hypothetical protein IPK81_15480 [Rhodospirillales bacterium]
MTCSHTGRDSHRDAGGMVCRIEGLRKQQRLDRRKKDQTEKRPGVDKDQDGPEGDQSDRE